MSKKIIPILITVLILGAIAWKLSDNKSKSEDEIKKEKNIKSVTIETAFLKQHEFNNGFQSTAILEPFETSKVLSETNGIVTFLNVKVGDKVLKGQVIAKIDSEIASKQYQQSLINLERVRNTYFKYKELDKQNNIPKAELENVEFELKSLEKQVDIAKKNLNASTITAPISGVIIEKQINKGEAVQPFSNIVSIADNSKLKAIINLNYLDWAALNQGDNVSIEYLENNTKVAGTITKKIEYPTQSKTYPVEIICSDKKNLLPGLWVTVASNQQSKSLKNAVPRSAIKIENNQATCLIIDNNSLKKVIVKTGRFDEKYIEIIEGLNSNQEVVVTASQSLNENTNVKNLIKKQTK